MNELSVTERETVVGLLRVGWSARRIERETGHRRETIARYGREAGVLPSKPATPTKVATDSKAASVAEVATDSKPATAAEVPTDCGGTRSACEVHRGFIEAEFGKRRNAVAIYQDLVEHHGYCGAYNAVKRFVRKLRVDDPKVSCRFETLPGQEAQVDYGEGALTRNPRTGKYRKPRLFVMTLGNSRQAFRKTVWNSSKQIWCELHEEAFAYMGGAPATIRLDNLKEGVADPDVYDPELNPLYAAMLKHYGVVALPCRPYAPDLKGKVESAVGYTQRTGLKGRRFESIEEQNTFLYHWNERWAATRIHGTTKRQVREMFEAERPFLMPLPTTRFEYYRVGERRVHFDGHIEVDGAYYSAPPRYVGSKVVVHIGRLWIRLLDERTQQLIREHAVTGKGQRRTIAADLPKQTPPQVEKIVARIARIGPNCGAFARALENERGVLALRSLFGVLDLARRYEREALEHACSFAVAAGSWRVRFLRTYLATHHAPKPLTERHRIIPQIEAYSKHFTTLAQGELFHDS
jgi:transposase